MRPGDTGEGELHPRADLGGPAHCGAQDRVKP